MTLFVLLDTCSIINFAVVDRVQLLLEVLDGRGRWTESVAAEARVADMPFGCLPKMQAGLGEPFVFDDLADILRIEDIRRALGGTSRRQLEHRGEAETIFAVANLPGLKNATVLTDDGNAAGYARAQGIRVMDTAGVLRRAYKQSLIDCPEPFIILQNMEARGRWVPVPPSHFSICPPKQRAS